MLLEGAQISLLISSEWDKTKQTKDEKKKNNKYIVVMTEDIQHRDEILTQEEAQTNDVPKHEKDDVPPVPVQEEGDVVDSDLPSSENVQEGKIVAYQIFSRYESFAQYIFNNHCHRCYRCLIINSLSLSLSLFRFWSTRTGQVVWTARTGDRARRVSGERSIFVGG